MEDLSQLGKLLGNPRQMQEKMEALQKQLAELTADGAAGGDMVKVVVNGERRIISVEISDDAMADRGMLQDLIAAAVSDALQKIEKTINQKMQNSLIGGMGGLF